jgi:hypothetical protein
MVLDQKSNLNMRLLGLILKVTLISSKKKTHMAMKTRKEKLVRCQSWAK